MPSNESLKLTRHSRLTCSRMERLSRRRSLSRLASIGLAALTLALGRRERLNHPSHQATWLLVENEYGIGSLS